MRKLASIQKIKALEPIEGADAIEKAQVLGWQLVVKKGEFKVGDFCVYCEIDSIMPDKPEYAFLKPRKMQINNIYKSLTLACEGKPYMENVRGKKSVCWKHKS